MKIGHKFEIEQRRVYERIWRGERGGRNDVIITSQ